LTSYSTTALRHIDELTAHYQQKRRPEAIRNLFAALARVEALIDAGPRRPRAFPATYRELARPGRAWLKEARYWIAYEQTDPPVIVAVFWEGADLGRRYPENP
jgi:plasmid stabilization system protein ParE